PEAFINLLALLGWNDGSEQEIFTKKELVERFSIDRVHSSGAHFDYEKAKWFNHEWIKRSDVGILKYEVQNMLSANGVTISDDAFLEKIIELVKDRCTLLTDFIDQSSFFFKTPEEIDKASILPRWNDQKKSFFSELIRTYKLITLWNAGELQNAMMKMS